ncbi:MAG: ribosome small subunit-dependent GTPase A [Bacillota bacterium]|nr:ribosome small subunit-dependent GTPase A [Bacillota bacterium]
MERNVLNKWGLNNFIVSNLENDEIKYLGRIVTEGDKIYKIATVNGILNGEVSGKLEYNAVNREDFPAVGDWVILDRNEKDTGNAVIKRVLPRKTKVSRKVAGRKSDEQIIASNMDYIFICMALNSDFNQRRLERYLTIVWDSGAEPVVLLTKADLCDNVDEKVLEAEEVAIGVDIYVSSSITGEGINELKKYINEGTTCAFVGSSGVGKSSLINYLKGEEFMKVKDIRNDDKGRHTTTHRELVQIPGGGIIIDTPGMREIQIMDVDDSLDRTFSDVEELTKMCRFTDCQHDTEPGCAVKKALKSGELDESRWDNYLKMKKEVAYFKRKNDKKLESEYWEKMKKRSKKVKDIYEFRKKHGLKK